MIGKCISAIKKLNYNLTEGELVQIANLRPTSEVEYYLVRSIIITTIVFIIIIIINIIIDYVHISIIFSSSQSISHHPYHRLLNTRFLFVISAHQIIEECSERLNDDQVAELRDTVLGCLGDT